MRKRAVAKKLLMQINANLQSYHQLIGRGVGRRVNHDVDHQRRHSAFVHDLLSPLQLQTLILGDVTALVQHLCINNPLTIIVLLIIYQSIE